MVWSAFRTLVWQMASRLGNPYIALTDTGDANPFLQQYLNVYAARTGCLQFALVAFTPVMNTGAYCLMDWTSGESSQLSLTFNGFSGNVGMAWVDNVYLDGVPLSIAGDYLGRYGASSEEQVALNTPNWPLNAAGTPLHFFQKGADSLYFDCAFASVVSSCYLSGRCYHPPYSSDSQVLMLGPEDLSLAAQFCRNELLRPLQPEKAMQYDQALLPLLVQRAEACGFKAREKSTMELPVPSQ